MQLRRPPPWLLPDVLVPFAVSRLALVAVAAISVGVLPYSPHVPPEWATVDHPLLAAFARWDGLWYRTIADEGYAYQPRGQSSVSFFPLYPLLMRAVAVATGASDHTALALVGVAISNAALLASAVLLVRLVRLDHDPADAARASLALFTFPTSFFLSAVYADVLFLVLTLAAFLAARTGRWWIAGALGGLTALSRPHGVLVVAPLALEWAHQHGFELRRMVRPALAALALVPAGLLLYMGYLWLAFRAPLAWVETQSSGWGRGLAMPWETLAWFFSQPLTLHRNEHSVVDLGFAALVAVLAVAAWRLTRPSYAALASVILLGAVSSGTLLSLMRVGGALFPVFVVLGVAGRNPLVERATLIIGATLGGVLMALFAQHYWVA